MNVGPQARVVRQVPTIVVGIGIDHDVIAIPEPIGTGIVVVRRGLKEETAHVEAFAIASMQPPDMLRPDRPGEASMLPGMSEVIVRIVSAGIVSYPAIVLSVNVRRRWMPGLIPIRPSLLALLGWMLRRLGRRGARRLWTVLRNVTASNSLLVSAMLLRLGGVRLLRLMLFRLTPLLPALLLCQQSLRENHYEYR